VSATDFLARLQRVKPTSKRGWTACCPAHDDRDPSLSIKLGDDDRILVNCHAGCTAEAIVEALGLSMRDLMPERPSRDFASWRAPRTVERREMGSAGFDRSDASTLWATSRARARNDDMVGRDSDVYRFLTKRQLMPAWELPVFGILAEQSGLHPSIQSWPKRGYQLIAPLFDQSGAVANVQARVIRCGEPKTLVPGGTRLSGTVFADSRGRSLLAGEAEADCVVFGEGLTDMLALAIASPFPVLTAPGTSCLVSAVGSWARGRRVLLAIDNDAAGQRAVAPTAEALYQQGALEVSAITWPGHAKDACDVLAARGEVGLRGFLERATRSGGA
jgi:hypothetical protein